MSEQGARALVLSDGQHGERRAGRVLLDPPPRASRDPSQCHHLVIRRRESRLVDGMRGPTALSRRTEDSLPVEHAFRGMHGSVRAQNSHDLRGNRHRLHYDGYAGYYPFGELPDRRGQSGCRSVLGRLLDLGDEMLGHLAVHSGRGVVRLDGQRLGDQVDLPPAGEPGRGRSAHERHHDGAAGSGGDTDGEAT